MPTIAEVEKLALALPETERAQLASNLIRSLPPALLDDDDGDAESDRRFAQYKADPRVGMTLEEFEQSMAAELTPEEEALIDSLPGVLHDEDEGYAEAERRDAEMDADPSMSITWEELKEMMRERLRSCH
jgi:putative addiction module component (TIGR02574 family)